MPDRLPMPKHLSPEALGLTAYTTQSIARMSEDEARSSLEQVLFLMSWIPPIKQRKGRVPDLRTGMQDPTVITRLWLQMARTDLLERLLALAPPKPVKVARSGRIMFRKGLWGLSGLRIPERPIQPPGPAN